MKRQASLPIEQTPIDDWTQAWAIAYELETAKEETKETSKTIPDNDEEEFFGHFDLCPVCETPGSLDSSELRLICNKCGIVIEDYTDAKPEWNTTPDKHTGVSDASRGDVINPLMPYASMNTEIVPTCKLQWKEYKMIKLSRWGAMSPMERSLCVVFSKIEKACTRHKVPSPVQYTSKSLFRRVYEINLQKHRLGDKREGLRGVKRDGLIAACTYMAFKIHDLYWKKNVVARVYEITSTEIRRGISIFWDLVKECPLTENLAKITGCKQYIKWFSVELELPRVFATFAARLFKNLKRYGIGASKQPQSVAAWCLWTVCQALKPNLTITTLSEITGISKATITDVERFTAGTERAALASVFAEDLCEICDITNPLTALKINDTARAICRTRMADTFPLWAFGRICCLFCAHDK